MIHLYWMLMGRRDHNLQYRWLMIDCLGFINLIVIMKMIQKGASLRVGTEGKENEPANAIHKLRSRA